MLSFAAGCWDAISARSIRAVILGIVQLHARSRSDESMRPHVVHTAKIAAVYAGTSVGWHHVVCTRQTLTNDRWKQGFVSLIFMIRKHRQIVLSSATSLPSFC